MTQNYSFEFFFIRKNVQQNDPLNNLQLKVQK